MSSQNLVKKDIISSKDIDRAVERKRRYEQNPPKHRSIQNFPKMRRTSDAVEILDRMVANDVNTREMVEQETVNALVAKLIYDALTNAHLTQKQLAELVGTQQPVIARLEDADYEGHSLTMLQRIARALNRHVEIRLANCA
jgi:predicted XRE-type DNA-binding protein